MTTPAHSPEPQEAPAVDRRSRKVYWLWGIGLFLPISTAIFCWLVVVPVWRTRSEMHAVFDKVQPFGGSAEPSYVEADLQEAVRQLGGPRKTASKIERFLAMPEWLRSDRRRTVEDWTIIRLLERCDGEAVGGLVVMTERGCYFPVRFKAAELLGDLGAKAEAAVPDLKRLLLHEDKDIREAAAESLEKIEAALRAAQALPSGLTLLTYNVLASRSLAADRIPSLLKILENSGAHVIALQEAAPWFIDTLRQEKWVKQYRSSPPLENGRAEGGLLLLSKLPISGSKYRRFSGGQGRGVLAVTLECEGRKMTVATVHLESYLEAGRIRATQIKESLELLKDADDAVLLGDFNFGDGEEPETSILPRGFVDMWRYLRPSEAGFTWNIEKSTMARTGSFPGEKSRRLDRILVRSDYWTSRVVNIVGDSPVNKEKKDIFASDHFGVIGLLKRSTR